MKGPFKREKRITIRIPEHDLNRLKSVAISDGRSISDYALRAILFAIKTADDHPMPRRQRFKPSKKRTIDVDALKAERNMAELALITASGEERATLQKRIKYIDNKIRCAWIPRRTQ